MITTLSGKPAVPLGLAARPDQDPACVPLARQRGINYFFTYGPGHTQFARELATILRTHREHVIVATGSGGRKRAGLLTSRRKLFAALGVNMIDVFFAEYIQPHEQIAPMFGPNGVLDELQKWKADGLVRYVGASVHDRNIANRLAADPRVDVLMNRFNMAHRKAITEVFPTALEKGTPVVAFTATRWGTLLKPNDHWSCGLPTAADCYRYCLAHRAVKLVLTAPRSIKELTENLAILNSPPMSSHERIRWEAYGDVVYHDGKDAYETRWP